MITMKIAALLWIPISTAASHKAWMRDLESLTEVCWFSVVWGLKVGGMKENSTGVVVTCRTARKQHSKCSSYMHVGKTKTQV
jgi:hypothetical protein